MNSDEENDIMLETEDVVDATDMIDDGEGEVVEKEEKDEDERRYIDEEEDTNYIEIDEPNIVDFSKEIPIIAPELRTSKNKLTRYEFIRMKGERIMQLSKGAKPLIKTNKNSEELTYNEIAVEEIKQNMIPFKIRRFVKDHYEIWTIDELDKKHLEPLFY
jgi:DNA-directed RNA polymerase subunit K/omega